MSVVIQGTIGERRGTIAIQYSLTPSWVTCKVYLPDEILRVVLAGRIAGRTEQVIAGRKDTNTR
jgi:hypothetical protein